MHAESDTIRCLNQLIEVCKDGEYGFGACAEYARAPVLQAQLLERSDAYRLSALQLQVRVGELGGAAEVTGSVAGTMHRGWVAVKAVLAVLDDQAVIEEALRGEEAAMQAFDAVLAAEQHHSLHAMLSPHFDAMSHSHAQLRSLRDSLPTSL
jgi:uncharacterized protein (TIGR02284 family)